MVNPSNELVSYIQSSIAAGNAPEAIRSGLKAAGWADSDIEAAFNVINAAPTPVSTTTSAPAPKGNNTILVVAAVVLLAVAIGITFLVVLINKQQPATVLDTNTNKNTQAIANIPSQSEPVNSAPLPNTEPEPVANTPITPETPPAQEPPKTTDDPAVNDADLRLAAIAIPDSENAYLPPAVLDKMVTNLEGEAYDEIHYYAELEGRISDPQIPKVKAYLVANEKLIAAFLAAADKPKFQIPEFADPQKLSAGFSPQYYDKMRKMTDIVLVDFFMRLRNKDREGANNEMLAIIKYAQKMSTSRIDTKGYGEALMMRSTGTGLLYIMDLKSLSQASLKKDLEIINGLSDTGPALTDIWKIEYSTQRSKMETMLANHNLLPEEAREANFADSYRFEPNKTANLFADYARKGVALAQTECKESVEPPHPTADRLKYLLISNEENALGQYLFESIRGYSPEYYNNFRCNPYSNLDDLAKRLRSEIK